jgi:uncharacterized membrane protein
MLLVTALTNLMLILSGALWCVMPHFSRPSIFFGVTIAPESATGPQARSILLRYRISVALSTLAAAAIGIVLQQVKPGLGIAVPVFLQLAAALSFWISANRQARDLAQPAPASRSISLQPRSPSLPGGWLFLLGPLVILGLAAWYLHSNWDSIPERFPIHWGMDGRPNRWTQRNFAGVYGVLLIGFISNAVVTAIAYSIVFKTRQISASGPSADRETRFKRNTYLFVMLIVYSTSVLFAVISTRPVWAAEPAALGAGVWAMILLPLLISVGFVAYAFRTGQGGARTIPPAETAPVGDGTPDECWKFGGNVYYNPNDPALLVEKRVGYGWTFNFANKLSWILMLFLLVGPLIVIVMLQLSNR